LGELKLLAEAHRDRMNRAKKINANMVPLKLIVRLTVTPEERSRIEKNIPGLLEQMAINDVLSETDIKLIDKTAADSATAESLCKDLEGSGYEPAQIAVVDRVRPERDEKDLPEGVIFMEYEDAIATPYHYDAAIEAMSKPDQPVLFDRYKKWFRIKPVQKVDLDQLRRELDQYQVVLMAA